MILGYLYDIYEHNIDIQVRFRWTPFTSALWDNRFVMPSDSLDLMNVSLTEFLELLFTGRAGIMKYEGLFEPKLATVTLY